MSNQTPWMYAPPTRSRPMITRHWIASVTQPNACMDPDDPAAWEGDTTTYPTDVTCEPCKRLSS